MKHLFYLAVLSITLFSCEKDDSDIAEKSSKNTEQNDRAGDRVTATISYYNNDGEDRLEGIIDSLSAEEGNTDEFDRAAIAVTE